MATLEKLVKAFEALKVFQPEGAVLDPKKKDVPVTKKDKIANCNAIADCICSSSLRNASDFPKFLGVAMETFFSMCDDPESDIRIVADECLNKTVKTIMENNLGRLQVELYKEIKKNGSQRSLRGALWRFADMCHLIRPQKCRPYVVNLLPCIARICKRQEESVQETLAQSMEKICPVLMGFTNDNEVKVLLKAFLPNLKQSSATCRRTAASGLGLVCQYSRKPLYFLSYLLNTLLDMVMPIEETTEVYTLLGVLLALRHLIPQVAAQEVNQQGSNLKGNYGRKVKEAEVKINLRQLQQVFEVLLHCSAHTDHNVVTATLETLQQLFKTLPQSLRNVLVKKHGIKESAIYGVERKGRSGSQSKIPSLADDMALEDDLDGGTTEVGRQRSSSTSGVGSLTSNSDTASDLESTLTDCESSERDVGIEINVQPSHETLEEMELEEGAYSNIDIGDIEEEKSTMSRSESAYSTTSLSETIHSEELAIPTDTVLRKGLSDDRLTSQRDEEEEKQEQAANGEREYYGNKAAAVVAPPPMTLESDQGSSSIREGELGSLLDNDLPLVYCVRMLCSRFLLTGYPHGLVPDRKVRVSVKALAIGCVAGALSISPRLLLKKLHKSSDVPGPLQDVKDILLYTTHSDPQLKGNTALLLGNVIQAAMTESRGRMDKWIKQEATKDFLRLDGLMGQLLSVLEDESPVATRLALVAMQGCIHHVLDSRHGEIGLKAVLSLLRLSSNTYWLVKVELVELLSVLDYKVISYLESLCLDVRRGSNHYIGVLNVQDKVLNQVLVVLLGDENHRVRQATASAINRIIPHLYFPIDNPQQDPVITMARDTCAEYLDPIMHEWSQPLQPLVHGLVEPFEYNLAEVPSASVEASLSRVIAVISHKLNVSTSKYLTNGCLHALSQLADVYKTTVYPAAWNCVTVPSPVAPPSGKDTNLHRGGILPMTISLLTFSQMALDPSTHRDILRLAGNLMAGLAYKCLRTTSAHTEGDGEESHWVAVGDRTLVTHIDTLLTHVARVLNICSHVIEEQLPGPPQAPRPVLPSLPVAPSLSPIKRKAKGIKEDITSQSQQTGQDKTPAKETPKEVEKDRGKKEALGSFYHHPHYVKIYDVLKSVYGSYKISLDLSSSEKFGVLLSTTLTVLAQLLEIAGLSDIGRHAEELLGYLKSSASVEPRTTVLCVQQLLKALFGTNIASQWESEEESNGPGHRSGKPTRLTLNMRPGLYHCCFTIPYTQFTQCLASATFRAATHLEQDDSSWMSWVRKRAERKVPAVLRPGSKTDKTTIASYIRLFEPLVIKALKQYTLTSSLELQRQVLDLLIQLVQLRVNYCLLDSDQIFIGFVIKQFEFIEEGQIRNSEVLVPHIFNFLVLLSYEKYHSKTIIGFPKIIQLCDGMMASGQDPNTHAIPALQAIVQDLFVIRATNKADLNKEIDTQREVVISMLLKLVQHYQVLEMLILVLHQSHKEGEDKWKRLSRQVTDMVLPLLARQQLNVDTQVGVDVVHRLFEVVAPSVFRPVDILLKTLFAPPEDLSTLIGLQRWLALVLIVLRVLISQSKEETILSRLKELGVGMYLYSDLVERHTQRREDPLNVRDVGMSRQGLSAQQVFTRFLFQVVGICAQELSLQCVRLPATEKEVGFLCQELSHLLLYFMHMFQSGIFRKVANTAMTMLDKPPPEGFFSIGEINTFFKELVTLHPTLTLQWCNVLILLNFEEQNFWMNLLLTNKRYVPARPRLSLTDSMDVLLSKTKSCSQEVARRGSLILYCDFVCENLNDAEKMTWVIINHVNDLVLLSSEPPVQDFIGAIHRNSAASGLLIQAIHSRSEHISKPLLVKQMLECLDPVHGSQSGALLVLLVDKFLSTPHLAVARLCDSIACRRVERLLAETPEVCKQQLSLQDITKMFEDMREHGLDVRHERLVSLLKKLKESAYTNKSATSKAGGEGGASTCQSREGGASTCQSPLSVIENTSQPIDKDVFEAFTRAQCCQSTVQARDCVLLLDKLDYSAILNIIIDKEFNLSILKECMSLGLSQTLVLQREVESIGTFSDAGAAAAESSPSRTNPTSDLLRASKVALFRHLNAIVNTLPVPHRLMNYSSNTAQEEEDYSEKMEDLLHDVTWFEALFPLAATVVELLVALKSLPRQPDLPVESVKDVARFSVLCLEVCYWMIQQGQFPTIQQLHMTLNLLCLVLQNKDTSFVIGQKAQVTWVCSTIRTVYQVLCSLLMVPGQRLVKLPHQESQDDIAGTGFDDMHNAIKACDQISELVQCLKSHLNPTTVHPSVPHFLVQPLRESIIGLARLPLVNSYARTPPLVWKMGWLPSPSGDLKTRLPPLPLDYLQEKEVLREFIFRVNTLGWTSRQQFEETWMGLLGVLNPVQREDEAALDVEEDVDRTQCQVEATWGITALLIQTLIAPVSGNPSGGALDLRSRSKPLAFLHTRVGHKLAHVRSIIEAELQTLSTACTQQCKKCRSRSWESEPQKSLCVENLERYHGNTAYHLGQISVETTWAFLGMLEQTAIASSESDSAPETPVTTPDHTPAKILPPVHKVSYSLDTVSRSSVSSGLDVHSCLQFLLDLYGQFLTPNPEPKVPLMLLNQTLKSVLALSDVFTEKQQFEWMLNTLLELYRVHPIEDEISIQYLVVAICKAAAVVGMDMQKYERVLKMVELHLRSTHLATKISTLYGCLYLLEAGMSEVIQGILPHLTDYLIRTLSSITQNTILSQHHVMVMWACAFYICENYTEDLKESDFPSKLIQTCVTSLQGSDTLISLPVYLEVVKGLERLVLTDVLTQQDMEAVIKLAVERLSSPCVQRSLAALGLVLTAMYSGKQNDQWTPTSLLDQPDFQTTQITQDPESLIVAMERVNVLFVRIRKGCPYEARVMTHILPLFLTDFFPPQDIMNKVIGEFLSSQQPHPTLIAGVVFKVFECLLYRKQQSVVQDWVILSLSNFTQRNPVAMAIWSLSCFFCSASPNPWLRAFFSHLLSRMGKLDSSDERLFLQSAIDFYGNLGEPATQHTFRSTFHGVASITPLYAQLVSLCDDVSKT